MPELHIRREAWPIRGAFTLSRGSRTVIEVVVAELADGLLRGRGESVPYDRFDETVDDVMDAIAGLRGDLGNDLDREALRGRLPPGAARNAVDCALWDLEAKRAQVRAWSLARLPAPAPVVTAYTLSLDSPARMGDAARGQSDRPVLKLKLAGAGDLERVAAVRAGAPGAELVVDANEGWSAADYAEMAPRLAEIGVTLIEQPLPAGRDEALRDLPRPVPLCADESCHDRATLDGLTGKYDVVNIKLDKTGGLTEALALAQAAQAAGFGLMIGCMVGTSLAMAPALLLAPEAQVVDLDGPLLLARDRRPGLNYEGSLVHPPPAELWG